MPCQAAKATSENGEKTTIGLISKKATFHVQHTFFVHFFAVVLHDYNVKLPETFLSRKFRKCSRSLFFSLRSFSPCIGGRYCAASIVTLRYKIFMLFFQQKKCLLCFLSLALDLCPPFSLRVSLARRFFSFSLSFSCSIFQICEHKN